MIKYSFSLFLVLFTTQLNTQPCTTKTKITIALISGITVGGITYILTQNNELRPYVSEHTPLSSNRKVSLIVPNELSYRTGQGILVGVITSYGVLKLLSLEPIKKPEDFSSGSFSS